MTEKRPAVDLGDETTSDEVARRPTATEEAPEAQRESIQP
jgi:hypothetical protein